MESVQKKNPLQHVLHHPTGICFSIILLLTFRRFTLQCDFVLIPKLIIQDLNVHNIAKIVEKRIWEPSTVDSIKLVIKGLSAFILNVERALG